MNTRIKLIYLRQHRTIQNALTRRQIFCQREQKAQGMLNVLPGIFVMYEQKYTSGRVFEVFAANCTVLP